MHTNTDNEGCDMLASKLARYTFHYPRIMKSMPKAIGSTVHPLDRMLALSDLIAHRRLAAVYTQIFELGTPTVEEIAAGLDSSRTTVYEDVNRLSDLGLIKQISETQPHTYRAAHVSMTVQTETEEYELTPAVIVALGQSRTNDTLRLYVDRHGASGLATALEYARAYRRGRMTARIMAREQDITVLEAETILQELRDVLRTVESDADTEIDLDALDEAVDANRTE